jgi:hypothetical protein
MRVLEKAGMHAEGGIEIDGNPLRLYAFPASRELPL